MTTNNTILLLYPAVTDQSAGQTLKDACHALGFAVEELVMTDNYAQVLDHLEKAVTPVVVC
jgi:hypothetical protein